MGNGNTSTNRAARKTMLLQANAGSMGTLSSRQRSRIWARDPAMARVAFARGERDPRRPCNLVLSSVIPPAGDEGSGDEAL